MLKLPSKSAVLVLLKSLLEKRIQAQEITYASLRQAAIEAPGRMVSRYDSAKAENSAAADTQAQRITETRKSLEILSDPFYVTPKADNARIEGGSLFQIEVLDESGGNQEIVYYIVPGGSGFEVEADGVSVQLISPSAPLAKAFFDRRVGDIVTLSTPQGQRKMRIISHT